MKKTVSKKRISLVTGISGFIGANLARALLVRGDEVHGIVNSSVHLIKIKDILKDIQLHVADITDAVKIKGIVEKIKPNHVFHLVHYGGNGGQNDAEKTRKVIIEGSAALYQACADLPDLKSIVNAGSSSEYGKRDEPMRENMILLPNTDYGLAKAWVTQYGQHLFREKNLPVITARLFSVYGSFEHRNRFMTEVILSCLKKESPKLANPKTARDFVFIDDVVEALILISEKGIPGEIYNVGTGEQRTLEEAAEIIALNTGFKKKLVWGSMKGRSFDTTNWRADISHTEQQLGWKAKTSLEEGIKKDVAWFRKNLRLYTEVVDKNVENLKKKALEARKIILTCSAQARLEHIGSAFSEIDILVALYSGILNVSSKQPNNPLRDRFVLSKGHGALGLYAVLYQQGFISKKDIANYGKNGSNLAGHPVYKSAPGIEMSTGSLGHGLNVGTGFALGAKLSKKKWRTFVMVSDGECDEGSTWEAIFFAAHHKLDNLTVIVDYNKIQSLGATKDVLNMEPFAEKWKNAGWEVQEIDGHNFKEILCALSNVPKQEGKPTVIIAHTVKGKGWKGMENTVDSHYKLVNAEDLKGIISSLT